MYNINKLRVDIVSCDDYQWMYINNMITDTCGHRIELCDFTEELNKYISSKHSGSTLYHIYGVDLIESFVEGEYIEEVCCGTPPKLYSEIPEEAFL